MFCCRTMRLSVLLFLRFFSGSSKAVVSNLPAQARLEDLEALLCNYGTVQNIEKLTSRDPNTQTLLVSYETQEQAQQ